MGENLTADSVTFQPTLPARGATCLYSSHARRLHHFNPRSPHGERRRSVWKTAASRAFQPTLPARGATNIFQVFEPGEEISTHAPRTGSDAHTVSRKLNAHTISTHAPRTGSDAERPLRRTLLRHFNPRSPHGERPYKRRLQHGNRRQFQPTLPARGATRSATVFGRCRNFNPRSPHGERHDLTRRARRADGISTHAPRTGSD